VARVVVDVMPKPEILDPQGKAVLGALPRLGFQGVTDVRQGKRFELEIEGELTDELLAEVRKMAETLLSNPVIEDFEVHVEDHFVSEAAVPVESAP
jgi:phosphoribosylformylglycinamidine synthase PurS subunit